MPKSIIRNLIAKGGAQIIGNVTQQGTVTFSDSAGTGDATINTVEAQDLNITATDATTTNADGGNIVLTSGTADGTGDDGAVIARGLLARKQAAPVAETGVATLTVADLVTGLITVTHTVGSTVALTVDTGALIDAGLQNFAVNDSFDFTIINLSAALADTATLTTAASGTTMVGQMTIDSAHADSEFPSSGTFRCRKTATSTFIIYRL